MSENKGAAPSLPGLNQGDLVLLAACQIFSNAANNSIDWDKVTAAINSQSVNSVKTRFNNAKKKAREYGMEASSEVGAVSKTAPRKSAKNTSKSPAGKLAYDTDGEEETGLTTANSDGGTPIPSPAKKQRPTSTLRPVASTTETTPRKRQAKKNEDGESGASPAKKKRGSKKATEKQTDAVASGNGQQLEVDANNVKFEDAKYIMDAALLDADLDAELESDLEI